VAQENDATRDEYERFVAQLDGPDADEVVLVFADWLQSVGDPRGELINLQHALETATGAERDRLLESEKRHLHTHRKKLLVDGFEAALTWHRGFVQRVVIGEKGLGSTAIARVFTHPSFRLLRELTVELFQSYSTIHLPKPLPTTLRSIVLSGGNLGLVDALLADQAPRLESLTLRGTVTLEALRHPSLRSLELGCADATETTYATGAEAPESFASRLATLDGRRLPSLNRLALKVDRNLGSAVTALVPNDALLTKLDELALTGDLSSSAIDLLVRARKRFRVIDVQGCRLDRADVAKLQKIADSVVEKEAAPAVAELQPVGDWLVRHTRKPEWGIGRVVEELDDGLEVEFEHGGKKTVRNVELLEDVK
jgi:uncharacterized protein (TIGR02996 family)